MLGMLQCPGEGWVLPVWVESGVPNASSPYLNFGFQRLPEIKDKHLAGIKAIHDVPLTSLPLLLSC